MIRRDATLIITILAITITAPVYAEDTQIFGGGSVNVPPNVLIIFDNSGSMAENVWVQGSSDEYDPSTVYTGSYNRRYVYREQWWGWESWQYIGTNEIVDSGEISCTDARNALNEHGHWQGQISSNGTRPCGTSYTVKNLRTGNYRNYLAAASPHWEQKIVVAKRTIANLIRTTTGVRFGVMIFNDEEGGRILAPVADRETTAEKDALIAQINSLSASTWTPLAETLAEAGLYYARKQSWFNSGVNYATAFDPAIEYRCQKNYIILMTDGESTQDRNSKLWDTNYINDKPIGDYDGDASTHIDEYHNSDGIAYASNGSDYLDDVAKFLYDEDLLKNMSDVNGVSFDNSDFPTQNLITYTIGFDIDHVLLSETAD
ncbi:MAG TPA: VWA domain-containing protein, partial [Desulfomonilia bacterium]|nr:VWA domain-containing protein [Desulfomonilia bacterium]